MRASLLFLCLLTGLSCCKHKPEEPMPRTPDQQACADDRLKVEMFFRHQYDEHERSVVRLHPELYRLLWTGSETLSSNSFSMTFSFTEASTNRMPMLGVRTGSAARATELTLESFEKNYPDEVSKIIGLNGLYLLMIPAVSWPKS